MKMMISFVTSPGTVLFSSVYMYNLFALFGRMQLYFVRVTNDLKDYMLLVKGITDKARTF